MSDQPEKIRKIVQVHYAGRANSAGSCSGSGEQSSCCGEVDIKSYGQAIGYALEELALLPDGANLGLGCGNPTAYADVKPGETILDLGSGGGMDAFIAAKLVGEHGRVIGVDMTPEMIELAQKNAAKGNYTQVEFRLGLIEDLPVEDEVVDLVISNCVVNLSTDKAKVYQEAYRVLKPGGRIAISDPVRVAEFPDVVKEAEDAYAGCIAGAASIDELKSYLVEAGFKQIQIVPKGADDEVISGWADEDLEIPLGQYVVSMLISAVKPKS